MGVAASSTLSIQDYSADEIGFAVAPRKLELLRRKLHAMQLETRKARKYLEEEVAASDACASKLDSNKRRIRLLLNEEAELITNRGYAFAECNRNGGAAVSNGGKVHSPGRSCPSRSTILTSGSAELADALVADARAEVEQLAREIIDAASIHTAQLGKVRELRVHVRDIRQKRRAEESAITRTRAAWERRRHAHQEILEVSEELALLRERERALWTEVAVAEGSAIAAAANGRSRTRGPELAVEALRKELHEEERSAKAAEEIEHAECKAEGCLRHEVAALTAGLQVSEDGARELAWKHKDIEAQSETLRCRCAEAGRKVKVLRASSGLAQATHKKLEAELSHQRSAACAWQSRATELESGQHELANEIGRTANRCRDILSKTFGRERRGATLA